MTEAIPPGTRYHINAFYFTGCGLQRRPALLPRDRKQHQSLRSFAYCTRPVRRFRRVKRQSDAQPLHRAMPLFSGFRRSFPNLTRLFGAAVSKKEEDRYRGGMMPGEFLLTQAACTAYSLKLLYLNKLPLRRKGIVLAQPKAYAGDCLCSQNHRRSVWAS